MNCLSCKINLVFGTTTDVTDLGDCLVIVRNVPCYKCSECNEIVYTGDVIKRLEIIVKNANQSINEIAIIDYNNLAA